MERTLIKDTINKIGEKVLIRGWVNSRRDLGKVVFLNLEDRGAILQSVVELNKISLPENVREQSVVEVEGTIVARPPKLVNAEMETGTVEMQCEKVSLIAPSDVQPFDLRDIDNVSLPVVLDYRPFSLRAGKQKAIFKVQEAIIDGFASTMRAQEFTQFQAPSLVGQAPEGGSELFKVDYYDYNAFLAQSPQVYKQILVGVYERVFTVSRAFRAEPSATSRHLSEYISLDAEMGFIQSWTDIMDMCELTIKGAIDYTQTNAAKFLKTYNASPVDTAIKIPRIKLREAQKIVGASQNEPDLSPEDERTICEWAKKEYNSDFIFITHFPTKKRPFYTMPDSEDPEYTLSFDLLFRGLEIITGGQRINDYEQLVANIEKWGNDKKSFEFYLQAFKFGMPPEGGFAIGTERVVKQLLNLENVSEASLFPRDMERIDQRLSTIQERKSAKK